MPVEKPDLLILVLEKCQTCGGVGRIPDLTGHPAERIRPDKPCPAHCESGYHPKRLTLLELMTEQITAAMLADYPQLDLLRGAAIPPPSDDLYARMPPKARRYGTMHVTRRGKALLKGEEPPDAEAS